jgi:hypothetical protein
MQALDVRVEELGNTHGGQAVRDSGVSLVKLCDEVMKLEGGRDLLPLFREYGRLYRKVVKSYIRKTDELNDVSARLDSIYGLVGELAIDLKPCSCTSTNCSNCACSKKKVPFCTDRCACRANGNCARGRYQGGDGLVLLADGRGDKASQEKAEQVRRAREKAKQKADVELQEALLAKEKAKKAARKAQKKVEALKKKKSKKKVRTPPTSEESSSEEEEEEEEESEEPRPRGASIVITSDDEEEDKKARKKKSERR